MIGGMVVTSHLRMPQLPPQSASLKPLYQWLSSPTVMCPRPSIWVATLSFMKMAQECQAILLGLSFLSSTDLTSPWRLMPSGPRKVRISPGLWPGHLYDSRSYGTPRSYTLPCLTDARADLIVAGVMALSAPTSSFSPQIQPQPLPFFQPFTSPGLSSTREVSFFSSSARACSPGVCTRAVYRPTRNMVAKAVTASPPRSHLMVESPFRVR